MAQLGSRHLFPQLEARAYLNHAAISPPSSRVIEAVNTAMRDYATRGVLAFLDWEQRRTTLRAQLGELVGASADEIAFIPNTSRGISEVALALPWVKGDRVVLFHGDFPANITPWQRAAELFGLELVFVDPNLFLGESGIQALKQQLERGVRLVASSVVQFQTGLRMPIRDIGALCHEYGAQLCVDAIQACGAVPIDVDTDHIDYLSTGSHKWLMGFEGAGFLYVKRRHQAALRPYTAGWLSHSHATDFLFLGEGHLKTDRQLRQDAAVFEGGTQSLLALAALGASVPMLLELGVEAISAHIDRYLDELEPALVGRGFTTLRAPLLSRRSGILCVKAPRANTELKLAARLREQGIVVGTPDGKLRFAPHFPNSRQEIPLVLEAVDAALSNV